MRAGEDWDAFMIYAKRFWFSNGIHHHYSYNKFTPGFSKEYFGNLLSAVGHELSDDAMVTMFDPTVDAKKVSKEENVDLIKASAVNFYGDGVTQKEVEDFYSAMSAKAGDKPISFGLNSKLVKGEDGTLKEEVYKSGGLYGPSIDRMNEELMMAKNFAESEHQAKGFDLLTEYYRTGDLKLWDAYNIAWVTDTVSDVDYIHGFVEVYNDPIGYRGSFETIVEVKDPIASANMKVVQENAQWFEDNSPIMDEHKKENVVGITYNFINVVGEAGDASPSTPIGVNLPNALWIRKMHGSKSVSLGNIVDAYDKAGGSGSLEEFCNDEDELNRVKEYGDLAGKLHTALHEVIGHASGQLNPGVGTPKETLKNYKSTIEEGRADLVALYFMMDPKMIELGLMPSLEVARAEYDNYIRNGMMYQLRRIEPGEVIEEDHMRNRQMVAAWVYEKGEADNVISKVSRDGKTYFEINDYEKLRDLFGALLRELQRVTSEGDFESAKRLVEDYGVQVDPDLHAEVLKRSEKLKTAPYGGFINPRLVQVKNDAGEVIDIKVEYPDDFVEQMLEYGRKYTTL
jgi:dipeptidyl-peptidase-3